MAGPLVSIICLCHNHATYVESAIGSVLQQSYAPVELIVVDDASKDGSADIIKKLSKTHGFQTIFNPSRLGNCKAFNRGLALAKGKYVIDLAADDLLMDTRVAEGVAMLEDKGAAYAVHFCDVALMLPDGTSAGTHYRRDASGRLLQSVPSGEIYKDLVARYIISAPSMMMRMDVLRELDGYDETLSYEDFDFWVRSSRNYRYAFSDRVLVAKRILPGSLSAHQQQRKNPHALSTARVCEKIYYMNKSAEENEALRTRIHYELWQAMVCECWDAVATYVKLLKKITKNPWPRVAGQMALRLKPRWYSFWKMLISWRATAKNRQ